MEKNCIEAVYNNVFGTWNLVNLCEKYHTERFMMVSTYCSPEEVNAKADQAEEMNMRKEPVEV